MTTERYFSAEYLWRAFLSDNARTESCYAMSQLLPYGLQRVTVAAKNAAIACGKSPLADAAPVPSGRLPKLSPRYTPPLQSVT